MVEIVFVAGEASGDRHAAALFRGLVESRPAGTELSAWGIGGSFMRQAGIELIADSSTWGAIGVVEAMRNVGTYFREMRHIKEEITRRRPAAIILVDFGYVNVRLARWARENEIGPIIYYLPPGSWRREQSPERSRTLAALTDLIVTPFQWSDENLRAGGAKSHWVGHPLVDLVSPSMPQEQFDAEYGVDPRRPIIALLPGSRTAEVNANLPMMLSASRIIGNRVPGTQFLLAAAPNLKREMLERMIQEEQRRGGGDSGSVFRVIERAGGRLRQAAASAIDAAAPGKALATNEGFTVKGNASGEGGDDAAPWRQITPPAGSAPTLAIVENLTYDCIARADLVITCSGTATLEAAILGKPMIIVYRGSTLMAIEYHLRKKKINMRHMGLPNIIADARIVPEMLGDEASPEAVAEVAVGMLVEPERLMETKRVLGEVVQPALGEPGAVRRAASLIWERILAGGGQGTE